MAHRIEISSKIPDARADAKIKHLQKTGLDGRVRSVEVVDVYTVDASLDTDQLRAISSMLANPVTQEASVDSPVHPARFSWAIEIGYLPGVTDNVGATTREGIEDLLKKELPAGVYSSQLLFLDGNLKRSDAEAVAGSLANPLIQRIHIKSREDFNQSRGMDVVVPRVRLNTPPRVDLVNLLESDDAALALLGKQGIPNPDGSRRGPLALDLTYMRAIQDYFRRLGRNPTDVELESIAQTWSEHCKHTIFANPLDEITDGLYRTFIQRATNKIRKKKGRKDFCVSVFKDNSGGIIFDENHLITDKVETHNSPSALDPFGGSITGIVGVNRDAIGFGLGAKPVINRYGFCFANPDDASPLYKGLGHTQQMLSPRAIMEGVIQGVNSGGNCSGIPTTQGFMYFDSRYKGKPLVFVGTVGLIPRTSAGRPSHVKEAQSGDYIVMIGGRVGKDGVHGATFSSEAMDSGSPATAVQIGDPITQKKLSDAIVKEARDLGLYTSITDNGAGGLSCSVAEMARESGGCSVQLDRVPLKYPGLAPWEIWISESQERMTLSVPKDKIDAFSDLMKRRGVESTVIGEFTRSGSCVVQYKGETIMDVDMDFLHDGLPARPLATAATPRIPDNEEPSFGEPDDLTRILYQMLSRPNIASTEFVSQQYDHEVQGGSVIKPLQGRGRVNGDATVTRPVLGSRRGVVLSQGMYPSYSDIDTYHMAAASIDTAIRNAIAAGADLEHLALLDNFCWCSSTEPERLGQLKNAVRACYDYAVAFGTPFISGKDSMFNDFKGYDADGKPIKISVPPTLLVSSIGVVHDVRNVVSIDAKQAGDIVYVLGETREELGASEYYALMGGKLRGKRFIGSTVPIVDAKRNRKLYASLSHAIKEGVVASAQSVHRGGLAVALAKISMAGMLGLEADVSGLVRDDFTLFSESQGRVVVTVASQYSSQFEDIMEGNAYTEIGKITAAPNFVLRNEFGSEIVRTNVHELLRSYRAEFGDC